MSDTIRTLNDLIATCRDSEEGFGKAAKGVHDDNLRHRFLGIERQRSDFAEEMTAAVRKLGGEPAESAHRSGTLHSGWRELEESIRPKDDPSFLAECETGEENTLRHYEHALTQELPPPVRAMVRGTGWRCRRRCWSCGTWSR
ncbi:MAG: PA2169 family four-helix-bundle protein [Acidobacteriia bacterium]|nr:PA2169 family four-helix-bundle protein [Terriglobia bacterium]